MNRFCFFRHGPGGVDRPESSDDRYIVRDAERDREIATGLTLADAHRLACELNDRCQRKAPPYDAR